MEREHLADAAQRGEWCSKLVRRVRDEFLPDALEARAFGDIADRGGEEQPLLRVEGGQAYVDGELATVGPPAEQFQPGSHRPGPRLGQVADPVADVRGPEPFGQEQLDRLAEHILAAVAEERFGL